MPSRILIRLPADERLARGHQPEPEPSSSKRSSEPSSSKGSTVNHQRTSHHSPRYQVNDHPPTSDPSSESSPRNHERCVERVVATEPQASQRPTELAQLRAIHRTNCRHGAANDPMHTPQASRRGDTRKPTGAGIPSSESPPRGCKPPAANGTGTAHPRPEIVTFLGAQVISEISGRRQFGRVRQPRHKQWLGRRTRAYTVP